MLLSLEFLDSLLVLLILDLCHLRSCELIHSSDTAPNLFLILSLHGLELKLLLLPLLLQIILQDHLIEHFHFSLNFLIGPVLNSLLLLAI